MKLKKSRYERTCKECKSIINKGDLYGQKTIALGSKKDGQSETYDGFAVTVHYMRIPVDVCKNCCEAKSCK
tara:strand:- start:273 stop:485 length:213 start_codon:yes stop_codon:yes gene_type:complete